MENRKVDEEADDKARKGRNMRDPVERKLMTEVVVLPKRHCNKEDCAQVITVVAHIERCLQIAHPPSVEAWKGVLAVLTDEDPEVQEMNAVVETAQQLHENHSEAGTASMRVSQEIERTMRTMEFRIPLTAAVFAAEARIHKLYTVAGIIKANCLVGPALVIVSLN
jgi:hypothetical protein